MSLPTPIPADLAEVIAARSRTIGDASRIRILDRLRAACASSCPSSRRSWRALGNPAAMRVER